MSERTRLRLGRGLFALGVVLLAVWVGANADAFLEQRSLARRLEALDRASDGTSKRSRLARLEASTSGLVGRIEIERAGISALVIEGTSSKALRRGVGHVVGTAFPGEQGNVGLAGHRDTYFRGLKKVVVGDRITLETPDGRFSYVVDSLLIVPPRRGDLLRSRNEARLTLVTCYPFYYIGPAPRRFIVSAHADGRLAARREPPSTPGGSAYASAMR